MKPLIEDGERLLKLTWKNLPKVCDISNTGKHGRETISEESNLYKEPLPFPIEKLDQININLKAQQEKNNKE